MLPKSTYYRHRAKFFDGAKWKDELSALSSSDSSESELECNMDVSLDDQLHCEGISQTFLASYVFLYN